jgi:hypothetical protein
VHRRIVAIVLLSLGAPAFLQCQAWLPARGDGYLSLNYVGLSTSDHLISSGQPQDRGPMQQSTASVGVFYGITDRLAVSADVPYVASKFTLAPGLAPNAHDLEAHIDDGSYHGTYQDFHAAVKYNVLRGAVMVTPFFELTIPTHQYETFGHSASGKYLRESRVGMNIGRLLNPILPRAYFDLRYAYSFVQNLEDMNLDRNNVDLEVGYFLKPTVAVRALAAVQKTMGGVEALVPPNSPYFPNHDRLERGHYFRMGGGISFALPRQTDLYLLLVTTISGKNVQSFTALGIGVSWNFKTRKVRRHDMQNDMQDDTPDATCTGGGVAPSDLEQRAILKRKRK